jgi:hypothetical protein
MVLFERRSRMAIGILALIAVSCGGPSLLAQGPPNSIVIPLPPMGWSSWNSFSNTVDSAVVVRQARAMASSGMKAAGYEYINMDEGWWHGQRDDAGNIVVDPKDWPALEPGERAGDMSNIVRYIHGLGEKAGIYTDAGTNGCGTYAPDLGPGYPYTGSEGHYEQDFTQFAKWGFDYLKIDYCGAGEENLDAAHQYEEIARALAHAEAATGHTMLLSICAGKSDPWMWAPNVGGLLTDIWRTGSDIVGPVVAGTPNAYKSMTCTKSCPREASFQRVLRNFDQGIHPEAQHTGFYNDPDMMVLGMPGLTDTENRVHMSLWVMSGAPLIVGADLTALSAPSLSVLTNADVVKVDQDPLGLQAVRVSEPRTGLEVWSKKLAKPGERAVLLLNRTGESSSISVDWSDLGLLGSVASKRKDLWTGKNVSASAKPIAATVPSQDAVLLLVTGQEIAPTRVQPEEMDSPQTPCFATACSNAKEFRFTHVASRSKIATIQIIYSNHDKLAHAGELRVNGQNRTRIVFPSTGTEGTGAIWIQATLDLPGAGNTLTIAADCSSTPQIEAISLQ